VVTFDYTAVASHAGVTGFTATATGLTNGHVIADIINNNTDAPQTVTYTITPRSIDTGCDDGDPITVVVTINPTPVVVATPTAETICNDGTTGITLTTPTTVTSGVVTFNYTATATGGPGAVTGFTTSAQNLLDGHVISDYINNTTNEVQFVAYQITPRSIVTGCTDGELVTVVIAVNPTPILSAYIEETIVCDSTSILIEVNDLLGNVHGSKVYQLTTTNAGGSVAGVQPTGEYSAGTDISNQLTNLTNEVQTVTYNFRARIKDPQENGSGYCDDGTDTTITIYVNPTPVMSVSIDETVYCDLSEITFEISDLNGTVLGEKMYTLTTVFENGLVTGVQPDGEYERVSFSNNLQNHSNEVQTIIYHFKAQIKDYRGAGSGYCDEGGDFTFTLYLNPTPVVTSSLINDRDTICTNTFANFELTSLTSVYAGVITFDYVAVPSGNPGDITGFIQSAGNLPQGTRINRKLNNHTNIPQYLTYTVTPYAHSIGCAPGIPTDVIIRINPTPIDSFYISKDIECYGAYSGSLALETAVGSGPYEIIWTGPDGFISNERSLDNIGFGRYNLRVTDANNCAAQGSIRLSNPDPIAVNFTNNHVSCFGGSDGQIQIATLREGGGPPYSFEWTGPEGFVFEDNKTQHQSNLIAGQYVVVITDANGCEYSSADFDPLNNLKLNEPGPMTIAIETKDAACDIYNDGSASSLVAGGTAPYTYLWEGPEGYVFENNTTPDIVNLTGGTYTLWVTDAKGCISFVQTEVGTLPPFRVTPVIVSDYNGYSVSCFGAADGIVELEILGEFGPFRYQWSDGSNGPGLNNVPAGEYHVHVLDAYNCPSEATIILTEPQELTMNFVVEDVSCFGFNDGKAFVDVNGGVGTKYFNWEDGQASANVSGLMAGNHFLRIADINNCFIDTIIMVNQPDPLIAYTIVADPYCEEINDGSIELTVTGGTTPYIYSWSNGETTQNIYNVKPDTYYVTIEDFNGCVLVETVNLNKVPMICMKIPNAFTPNDDGFNDYWVIGSSVAGTLGELYPWSVVEVYNRAGQLVYRSREGYPVPWDGTFNGHKLPMDSYFYVIFRNNGEPPISGHVTIIR
jgi:gliding motility-associated-like protein